MFAVVGLTQGQVVAGPMQQPNMRLANALHAELQRLGSASGPAEHIVVYGVEPDDFEVMQQLGDRWQFGPDQSSEFPDRGCFPFRN